jgi:uncharacterized protein
MGSKLMATAIAMAAVWPAPPARAQHFINVLTGGTSGVYYPLGVAIGKIYGDKLPDVRTQVQATKPRSCCNRAAARSRLRRGTR